MKHLVFYDGECGLCDAVVRFLLRVDKKKLFVFAPLKGRHAATFLSDLPPKKLLDSVILLENYQGTPKRYLYGKAAFRTLWLLGSTWRLLGWPFFLPSPLYNWGYKLVARYRYRLFGKAACTLIKSPSHADRFLD